jgi:predicted mannosyl-3-phosphoglycerate phosphatase (HAD superfamily)
VRCWLKTPEGKKYKSEQQRVFQARRRLNQRKIQIVDLCKQVVALSAKDSESAQNVVILQLYQALDKIKGAVALAKE